MARRFGWTGFMKCRLFRDTSTSIFSLSFSAAPCSVMAVCEDWPRGVEAVGGKALNRGMGLNRDYAVQARDCGSFM